MIDHVSIRVSDLAKSAAFYETVLAVLGYKRFGALDGSDYDGAVGFGFEHHDDDSGHLWLVKEDYLTQNVHIAFRAKDEAMVRSFYQTALAVGAKDNGSPGKRPEYGESYFGAFVLDPDGNNVEATCYLTK